MVTKTVQEQDKGKNQEETLQQMWDQHRAKPQPGIITDAVYSLNVWNDQALLGLHVLGTATDVAAPRTVSSSRVFLLFVWCVWLLVAPKEQSSEPYGVSGDAVAPRGKISLEGYLKETGD